MIPAMPQFKTLNPLIKLEGSPLYINRENKHWEKKGSAPRLAGISSFGFGGAYAHVVVEEWPDQLSYNGTGSDNIGFALIPLSAKKADRLKEYSKDLLHYLKKSRDILKTPIPISSLAYSLQVGREAMDFRAVFIVNSTDELIDKLEDYIEGKPNINNVLSGQVRDDNKTINLFKEDEFLNEAVRKWIEHNYVEKLAELWVMGGNIDWNLFYMHGTKPLRISLPTYSFAKESYWVSDVDTAKQNKPADINLCKSHESEMIKIQSKSNVHETQAKEALQEVMEVNLELLIERDLKKIVQEILKVSQDQLDNDTYLAEFGFDSISLSIFSKKLSELYQLNITPATLFGCPTIGNLINYLLNEHLSVVEEFYKIGKTKETEGVGQSANSNLASEKPNFGEIEAATDEPVAIIGISCKFPGAENCEEFWSNLLEGRDSITEIPLERWDWQKIYEKLEKNKKRTSIKWGGFINGAGDFDPEFFGISQEEAMLMDPNQRMMLMHAYMAIEDAGYDPESLAGSNTGVFIGVGNSDYNSLFNIMGMNSVATNMLSSMGPNRISYFLDLHGPSEPVENACASALIAIRHAVMSINSGKCNMAIVGGVNTVLTPAGHIDMGANGLLSVNGKCKPFSEDADGFVRSEGVGILVLKKLSSARKDGDHIYGLVCGGSENHGGRSNFLMAPNPVSQAAVLEKAYQEAGIDPSTVTYIEAHGTGTLLGDNIEMDSLKNAFKKLYNTTGEAASDKWTTKCCGVGSVKSNIGHTEVASGMAGVIKVLMQMKHKVLVPTINCGEMNPYIQLEDTPFYIVKEKQEWKPLLDASGKAMPRRAGVNAFGLGGVNAHIILEEYIQPQKMVSDVGARPHLVIFSAKNQERLQKVVRKMIEFVKSKSDICMEDLAYTLQVGRAQQETRLAMVAGTTEELLAGLRKYLNPEESSDVKLITMKNLNTEYSKIIDSFSGHKKEALLREIIAANDLEKLGVYWVQGNSVSWSSFNANNKARRISLPTYPFMKQHCWIKALSKLPQYMQTKDEGISEFQVSNDECFAISGCVIQRQDEKNYKHSELYKSWF
ncbi:MAG: Polyketide synthase PksJ [Firmicutes bacterium ADurb.Bin419]|nr:MAG: Polyketide synthase PksJ [Firmicutes bacterium ADurb.Bin419]